MNEPRVYKNSPIVFGFFILIVGVLFVGLFANFGRANWPSMLPFGVIFGVAFLVIFFSISSKTIISDEEISTQNILGTKTLRWSEINQVSGRGYRIKLSDIDRALTVSPNPQLPGYPEVIEWIGTKRPDLFDPQLYNEMSKNWLGTILTVVVGLLFIGTSLFAYTQENSIFLPFLILALIGVVFIGTTLAAPQAISLQGKSIVIGYLFNQKTLSADELASVDLRVTQTRNGKQYYAVLNLVNRKMIRISGFGPNLPVVYLVLRNWHKKSLGMTGR